MSIELHPWNPKIEADVICTRPQERCVVCCGSLPRLFPPPLFCLCHFPEAATANGRRQYLGSRDKNLQHGAHRVDNCTIQLRAQSPSQIQRELGNPTIVAAKALGFQLSYPSYHVKDTTCEIFTQVPNSAVKNLIFSHVLFKVHHGVGCLQSHANFAAH